MTAARGRARWQGRSGWRTPPGRPRPRRDPASGDAPQHGHRGDTIGHGVSAGQDVGPATGQPDHPEPLHAEPVGDDRHVGREVEHRSVPERRRRADTWPIDADEPDVELFGGQSGRLRNLSPGAGGAVHPEDGPPARGPNSAKPSRRPVFTSMVPSTRAGVIPLTSSRCSAMSGHGTGQG